MPPSSRGERHQSLSRGSWLTSASSARVVFSGAPLNAPISAALLFNGDLVVSNTADNILVEISQTGNVMDTQNLDTGAAGALFGIVATGSAGGVFFDRITKLFIQRNFSPWDTKPVIAGFFNIVHAENPGAARLYERLGFLPIDDPHATHLLSFEL